MPLPKIFMVPGGPCLPGYLQPLEPLLDAKEILLRDAQASPVDGPFTIDGLLEDISSELEGVDRRILLGHSAGALIALAYAAKYKLDGLILLNPGPMSEASETIFGNVVHTRNREIDPEYDRNLKVRSDVFESADSESKATAFLNLADLYWPAYFVSRKTPRELKISLPKGAAISSILEDYSARVHAGAFADAAKLVSCPALMIHGDDDPIPYGETRDLLSSAISNFEFALLDGSGHFPWFETPLALREAILSWTNKLD